MLTKKLPPKRTREQACAALVASARPVAGVVMATRESLATGRAPEPAKLPRAARTKQSIRDSAKGEECHVRLVGICNGRTDTTVWSHWPGIDGDRGMGIKALDACGAYACVACHDAVDGRTHTGPSVDRGAIAYAWMLGHLRSLVALARKGLL